jgi:hypothetical protein
VNAETVSTMPWVGVAAPKTLDSPSGEGRWLWQPDSLSPWKDVKVFASQTDGRLIAIMPMSGACHYAEGLGGEWVAVNAASPTERVEQRRTAHE